MPDERARRAVPTREPGGDSQDPHGYDAIWYKPMMEEALDPSSGLPKASVVDIDAHTGIFNDQLFEISKTRLWQLRTTNNFLCSGSMLGLNGGYTGLSTFYSLVDPNQVNPPWQWTGAGEACRHEYIGWSDDLFLDIWDAAGHHDATCIYITNTGCRDNMISC